MKKSVILLIIITVISVFIFGGCGESSQESKKVVVAQQYGLGYAPIMVIQKKGLIEKHYEGAQVEWVQLGSGGAIREAMAAGTVDVGSMGVPPFLISWDKGLGFRVISALCKMPLGLQTYHDEIEKLGDITPDMKIALPSPGSIQHILLSMACEKQLDDPTALDDQIVAMTHPDGANALINEVDIDAHYTSPPYIFMELETETIHQVLDAEKDCFGGPFTFLVTIGTEKFKESSPELFEAVADALDEAIIWIDENPDEAAELLAEVMDMEKDEVCKQLTWEGVEFSRNPEGMLEFLDFMKESGYVTKTTDDVSELIWDNLDYKKAN
ncbi:MAG: ABC transporter substrate-binding protein [Actinomycetota bacterium]|nr:ABC transporter substrate-binding protein [Actinomycetota bacterium]